MPNLLKSLFVSFLVIIGSSHLFAQAYNFNFLSIQNGLPQSQAFCLDFDDDNQVWIGTQGGGLCRYDGKEFLYFTKNDSLLSNRIYSLKNINNQLWIGQKGGVSVFNSDGSFVCNYYSDNPNQTIQDIVFFDDQIYLASNDGLLTINENKVEPFLDNPNLKQLNIFKFFTPDTSNLWLCTEKGLISFDNVFGKLNKGKGLSHNNVQEVVVFNDEWVLGTYGGGLNFYKKNEIYQKEKFRDLNDAIVLSLYVSQQNELWIGTLNKGVFRYVAETDDLRNFKTSNGLSGNHIKTIKSDVWGNIWIGTSGGGISVYQNSPFLKYTSASGLNGNYVFSVLNDSKNNLWLGTEGTGVMRINDTSRVLFDEEYGFYSEKVKAIFEDSRGNIWLGTEGKGVGLYRSVDNKDTIYKFNASSGLYGNWVRSFAEDQKNKRIYIGSSENGIFYMNYNSKNYQNISFKRLKDETLGDLKGVGDLHFDNNRLWYVTAAGDYGFYSSNRECKRFFEPKVSFRNIVGSDSVFWLGTKDNGILKIKILGDSLVHTKWITAANSGVIASNNVYQLVLHKNQLWVGTERGLDRLELDSSHVIQKSEHFGYEEGFEGVETNINAGHFDKAGNFWSGTVDGLYLYKGLSPNILRENPPTLTLSDFRIVFESIENTRFAENFEKGKVIKSILLNYNENHISFSFKAIHYSFPERIKYRWKLDGVESDWNPATKVNIATYPNLLPGKYTFNVQASVDDQWKLTPLTVDFTIDKPYWDKFWFKFAYYSTGGLILILVILLLFKRQKRKNKELNEKLKLEKNLLELEQKALRLQMNPHFIFNVLNSIHNLIILNDSDKARYALSKFSKLMRQVLENSREKLISIDDEMKTLKNYVQLERLTSNIDVELEFIIGDLVDTEEEVLPPLMIQPFVENAIIHGLMGSGKKGKIVVAFDWMNENVLVCSVQDNGVGRTVSAKRNAQKDVYHKSTALQVAQERLANINQSQNFNPFEIVDLLEENGTPKGTKVIMRLLV